MRAPTSRQLRIVAEIAKSGKISAAASALGVTGPAVTLQLQQLENIVGLPLFERDKRLMRPTAAGEILLDCARGVDERLRSCVEALDALAGRRAGKVHIGIASTAKYFAATALGGFKERAPDLDLRLHVANRSEVVKALASLDTDLAIMGHPPDELKVVSFELGDHPHVVIASPRHPLNARRRIPIERLARETLLLREQGSGTRILTERLLAKADVRPRNFMEISSNETIKQAVMADFGLALISAHTIAAEIESQRLVVLDVMGLPIVRKWYLVRNHQKRLLPPAEALWNFLVQEGRNYLPDVGHPERT